MFTFPGLTHCTAHNSGAEAQELVHKNISQVILTQPVYDSVTEKLGSHEQI